MKTLSVIKNFIVFKDGLLDWNSLAHRNVLSVYIGREVIDNNRYVSDEALILGIVKRLP